MHQFLFSELCSRVQVQCFDSQFCCLWLCVASCCQTDSSNNRIHFSSDDDFIWVYLLLDEHKHAIFLSLSKYRWPQNSLSWLFRLRAFSQFHFHRWKRGEFFINKQKDSHFDVEPEYLETKGQTNKHWLGDT